jgi:hypothetical protein
LWSPISQPQHLLLVTLLQRNLFGESALIQVGIRHESYTNTDAITPPRHGMIEDTKARKLSATTNMDP